MAVLALFRPFKELHLSQVIPDIVIQSVFKSSNWSSYIWLPFIYFLYNAGFRLSIWYIILHCTIYRNLQSNKLNYNNKLHTFKTQYFTVTNIFFYDSALYIYVMEVLGNPGSIKV
jgi:hypothetical protein